MDESFLQQEILFIKDVLNFFVYESKYMLHVCRCLETKVGISFSGVGVL